MNLLGLVWHQYRFDQKTFWRDSAAVGFTVAFPIIFLFMFVAIFGNDRFEVDGEIVKGATYYVPGLTALALVGATLVNLAISLTAERERGTLKRIRATPLPPWVFIAGRVLTATAVGAVMVSLLLVIGRIVYGVRIPAATLPGVALTVVASTAAMCCIGIGITAVIPTERAAPAIVNGLILPLYFISGIFASNEVLPRWMQRVGDVFPIKHVFSALLTALLPGSPAPGIAWGHLGIVVAWGAAFVVVAVATFKWVPRAR